MIYRRAAATKMGLPVFLPASAININIIAPENTHDGDGGDGDDERWRAHEKKRWIRGDGLITDCVTSEAVINLDGCPSTPSLTSASSKAKKGRPFFCVRACVRCARGTQRIPRQAIHQSGGPGVFAVPVVFCIVAARNSFCCAREKKSADHYYSRRFINHAVANGPPLSSVSVESGTAERERGQSRFGGRLSADRPRPSPESGTFVKLPIAYFSSGLSPGPG